MAGTTDLGFPYPSGSDIADWDGALQDGLTSVDGQFRSLGNLLTTPIALTSTTAGVTATGGTIATSSGVVLAPASTSVLSTATGSDAMTVLFLAASGSRVAVSAGRTYTAHLKVHRGAGTRSARIRIYWLNSSNGIISSSSAASVATSGSAWTRLMLTATAPAGAVTAYIMGIGDTGDTSDQLYWAQPGIWEGTGGVWAVPGRPILGLLPETGWLTEDHYAAGSVTVPKLGADVLPYVLANLPDPVMSLATGSPDLITFPGGAAQTMQARTGIVQTYQVLDASANVVQGSNDDYAPIQVTRCWNEWIGGNHASIVWRQPVGSLTTADVGKVWSNGTWYTTLMGIDGSQALWSALHNAAVTVLTAATPSGTYTCGGSPDLVWSSPVATDELSLTKSTTDVAVSWSDGSPRVLQRRASQVLTAYDLLITAQQASVGTPVTAADADTFGTLSATWTWPQSSPGVAIIEVSWSATLATTIKQWSGLQMVRATGGQVAAVGVTAGHTYVTWGAAGVAVTTPPSTWADSIPPAVAMTYNSYGGVAVGILDSTTDRADLTDDALNWSSVHKAYPIAAGPGAGTVAAGQTVTVRGFRSISTDTSDRQVHVVTDDGVTRWWLVAGSTGAAQHPALPGLVAGTVTQTRGTATVDTVVTDAGITVTGAGWAEGTITL